MSIVIKMMCPDCCLLVYIHRRCSSSIDGTVGRFTVEPTCGVNQGNLLPSLRRSRSPAVGESSPEEETQRADEGSARAPSPLVHGRISSDDSDSEVHEETLDFHSSASHPRPLAVSISGAVCW